MSRLISMRGRFITNVAALCGPPSGGGACPFPSGLGVVARYRADMGVTTSLGNVTAVADQSGNGNSLTVTGTVPFSATGSAHGQPAFNFLEADGGALNTASLSVAMGGGSSVSVFVLGQLLTNADINAGLVSMINNAGDSDYANGVAFTRNGAGAGTGIQINNDIAGDTNFPLATQSRVGFVYDGTNSQGYYNGSTYGPADPVTFTNNNTTQIAIGNRILGGSIGGNAWEGPISEIVITNTALNSTQIASLDAYFTCQWGM